MTLTKITPAEARARIADGAALIDQYLAPA